MRKNYRLNDLGISLPIVLAVAGLIMANGYYFLVADHSTSTRTAAVKTVLREEAEKKRLASNLSDFKVCTANFQGISRTALLNQTTPAITQLTKNGVVIIKNGTDFVNDTGSPSFNTNSGIPGQLQTHRVKKMYLRNTRPDLAVPDPSVEATRYSLIVEFETRLDSVATDPGQVSRKNINLNTGKNQVMIDIPMYIEFTGANVTKCYARPDTATEQTGMFTAIASACQGETANIVNTPYYGCDHKVNPINCNGNPHEYINRVFLTGSIPTFSCSTLSSDCNPGSPATQAFAQSMTNSAFVCTRLESCGPGTAIMRNGAGVACSRTCKSDGLSDQYLFSSYNPATNSLVCYQRQYLCPLGQSAYRIYPDGHADCATIPYKNKDCGFNAYATDFNPPNAANTFGCSSFSRSRSCSNTNRYTFIRTLNTANTLASCTTFTQ